MADQTLTLRIPEQLYQRIQQHEEGWHDLAAGA